MKNKKVYFSGINGIGMSGIAKILKLQGYDVSGSDLSYTNMTKSLEDIGIKVNISQVEENIKDFNPDIYVYSTAIKKNNKEYIYAINNVSDIRRRGKMLADIFNKFNCKIAVAGTHGKTTTSSMISTSLLKKDPYVVVGGIVPGINSNSRVGNSDLFIVEADESDNSFLELYPNYSVITNIESDHLEHHGNLENIKNSFIQFISQTDKKIILSSDCENIKSLDLSKYEDRIVRYSINKESDIYAKNIRVENGLTKYEVILNYKSIGEFMLKVPGLHNVSNSLAAIYIANELGVSIEDIKKSLLEFTGAKRRYQLIYDNDIKIIDDYAHHPTEINATIKAARSIEKGKIIAVFEPHRYTRTSFFMDEFAKALVEANEVILLPIYAASEENTENISSFDLKEKIKLLDNNKKVEVVLPDILIEKMCCESKKDEVYLFMGAGLISKLAYTISDKLKG
ncbi:UDP-N-acetylmuramate--L-alanine ligase [Oceanivirga miroungae]|uniref:UDP-N-acetylmuramate--L-alanine ligase n=1 Tax=Oceanivirga miroungae TaxID=1130046 RepID=A0A6I8MB03_9FUSO|nr:UDP-N-acetylmuramate--L-alanine ligase [Oceanivirga miroungae]VWL85936.1 UDP-N-acetylmuramate-L-alanine ligase [Oceanivirga miroungae]